MSQIFLECGLSRATVLPGRGGLLTSLFFDGQPDNVLWMPENFNSHDSSWPGGGVPFLFPFAGRVWDQGELYKYRLDDQSYPMPLHGFSWAMSWKIKEARKQELHLDLSSNEQTEAVYPFQFEINLSYILSPNQLEIHVKVTYHRAQAKSRRMPVAFGWHPYFRSKHFDSVLIPAGKYHAVTPQGGTGKTGDVSALLGPPPWSSEHDALKSLIFSDLQNSPSVLKKTSTPEIRITYGPQGVHNHIVTWSNTPKDFLCIEPWMSLPDAVATPSGCQWLEEGGTLKGWLSISSHS